uniref:Putative transcriptional repressor ctcf n=1 Tax=Anopheles triannulatus TaxID=58253 RepID=A0A2M4AGD0_9DIPT
MNTKRTKPDRPGGGIRKFFRNTTTEVEEAATSSRKKVPETRSAKQQPQQLRKPLQKVEPESEAEELAVVEQEGTEGEERGCFFMDQKGNYYYKADDDAEPMLTNLGTDVSDAFGELDGNLIKDAESDRYVLIMDEDDQRSTIMPDDGDQQADDNEVYEFEEHEYVIPEAKARKQTRKKAGSTASTYMCNYCNYTSNKLFLLSRHLKSHSEDRPHKCSVCERGFKTLASLQNHLNAHTGTKPHRCKRCDSCFTTSGELVRHVRYRHTLERPHKCTECDYSSVELSKLKRHIRTHTGEKPFQCPHCTYASPDKFKLTRHMRIHTGEKPYSCDVCFARFTQSNSLKAHKMIHQVGDKPVFQCELCPTTCGRKTDLRIHVQKLHTSDKPIKCKRCDGSFPDRYSYKMHAKTHEGEKCYKCDFCPYASISLRHLESHLLLHTDQKPFQCNQCTQTFRQKQLLKRHINLYHNPDYVQPEPRAKTHVCPSCPRRFRHKGNLIRHMSLHDPESTMHEEKMALREGRQKKVHILLEEEVYEDEEDDVVGEEDGEDGEEAEDAEDQEQTQRSSPVSDAVAGEEDDGQFVLLEVIRLQDKDKPAKSPKTVTAKEPSRRSPRTRPALAESAVASGTGKRTTKPLLHNTKLKKLSMEVREDDEDLDGENTELELLPHQEEDDEDDAQHIVIQQSGDESESEFILTAEDLEDAEMLLPSLPATKRSRYDISTIHVTQSEMEKNMSTCFGFEDDDDEDDETVDNKGTITLLN